MSAQPSHRGGALVSAKRSHRGGALVSAVHPSGPTPARVADAARLRATVAAVPDPEIPVLTIDDLGILRDLRIEGDRVEVDITPTYSGCPAMDVIRAGIEAALRAQGCAEVSVRTILSPAWSTDWMSDTGRRRLLDYGIAPPAPVAAAGMTALPLSVACPQCGSAHTEELSRFGSTPCKALRRCGSCREPFDHFKPH